MYWEECVVGEEPHYCGVSQWRYCKWLVGGVNGSQRNKRERERERERRSVIERILTGDSETVEHDMSRVGERKENIWLIRNLVL